MSPAEIQTICMAWNEMNIIRARDGVPYCHDGRQSDVTQEHWDEIMFRLQLIIERETGKPAHCNPYLYL